jgi:hypothetical protein
MYTLQAYKLCHFTTMSDIYARHTQDICQCRLRQQTMHFLVWHILQPVYVGVIFLRNVD